MTYIPSLTCLCDQRAASRGLLAQDAPAAGIERSGSSNAAIMSRIDSLSTLAQKLNEDPNWSVGISPIFSLRKKENVDGETK